VAKPCLPAGELPNETPIFIAVARDTRSFLPWLRESCLPDGPTQGLEADDSTINRRRVPNRGQRTAVPGLGEGMSFQTFTLLEDRCVRFLVKNLGKGLPESVVREELETMNIRVRES
jgi:hypothetical protein